MNEHARTMRRWNNSRIGTGAYDMADDLVDVIKPWLEKHWKPGIDPNDLAFVASEVVSLVSVSLDLYRKFNSGLLREDKPEAKPVIENKYISKGDY